MRLSRSNFSGSGNSNGNGEDGRNHPAPEARVEAAPPPLQVSMPAPQDQYPSSHEKSGNDQDAPLWQKAFTLRPNVRFTRTPDNAMSKRDETIMDKQAAPHASAASAALPQPSHARHMSAPSSPSVASQPGFAPTGHGARALVNDLRRQLAATVNGTERPALPTTNAPAMAPNRASQPATPGQSKQSATSPAPSQGGSSAPQTAAATTTARGYARPTLGYIPDHLLWEMISLGGGDGARVESSAPARPVQAAQPPAYRPQPPRAQSIAADPFQASAAILARPTRPQDVDQPLALSLYRTIEPRRPESIAPVAQPAATMPAPVRTSEPHTIPAPLATTMPSRLDGHALSRRFSAAPSAIDDYEFPSLDLLQAPGERQTDTMSPEALEQSAGLLESILEDFGVKGEIIDVRPGPVVTLYEFEPAPGVKSSRVIGLADDIARSMSALSARVAVVPGRNVIGIELPNQTRETVYLRELIESGSYAGTGFRLPLCLGKTIGGEPVIAELAKMPHLLVAGTTGSGKSVAINTMILSLIYRLRPEECRLIMVDPKMLELSVYDGIPHLLTPVVTDPKKAVLALKWAVREMEERYKKMSRLGVRNIDGYNSRVAVARAEGETIKLSVQAGFDRQTGETIFEEQEMDLTALPYIVVIVDEMADLMMVAGKDIEGAIQRLAQMARAAGIHLIMATQRPSVDVITGTIKANFPTRISFQVTSKIDSRTILGEQGAEHLLGQGDMLNMVGGGRIQRVHGPFVSDQEVERIVDHLKTQGRPAYLGSVTEDTEEPEAEEEDGAVFDKTSMGEEDGDDLYDRAVKIVMRDRKCSTSYIQRRLSIGYNRAASLVERMEQEGLVGAANHVGKREIIDGRPTEQSGDRDD